MKQYELEVLDDKQKDKTFWNPNEDDNKYITETAGFVPLEVKFKRFEQAGIVAQFNESEFTSSDYRDMYLNPDFQISPEDDMEEAFEKMQAQRDFINQIAAKKKAESVEPEKVEAGTQEPKKEDKKAAQSAE